MGVIEEIALGFSDIVIPGFILLFVWIFVGTMLAAMERLNSSTGGQNSAGDQTDVVNQIKEWYVEGRIGEQELEKKLDIHVKSQSGGKDAE